MNKTAFSSKEHEFSMSTSRLGRLRGLLMQLKYKLPAVFDSYRLCR